ncbi:translation initiation factor 1A [Moesziomyces antarcticus T-34]|uniref:Eukaryotic translation initiation factor 4C n=1 Tax=Pseudozyma antarctica (strain T-34) TaxID=1151754 RepID=M9MH25_PSEA3|nr:translation initiation factor 1A [Moesziomyces antarcticus T-34]
MPKNKGKGGKNRRRGKNDVGDKRELVLKDEGQGKLPPPPPCLAICNPATAQLFTDSCFSSRSIEYAQVLKMLGNGRLEAQCFDGEKRLAHIRGKLRKKVWINQGDIILISLRDFQDGKADVIQKYNADEARALKQQGELPESAKINETDTFGEEEGGDVEFQEGSDDDDEDSDDDDDLDDL